MDIVDVAVFESDEEENMEQFERIRRPKRFKIRNNFFEDMDELEFFNRFRLRKNTCFQLLQEIEEDIRSPTNRNSALTPATKLFVTLRFYATGSMLLVAGDFAGVSKTAACNCIKVVTTVIAAMHNRYIRFPETRALKVEQQVRFYRIARFPSVLGAIDCTHIKIESPGGLNAEEYRNRKGFFSWNVQVVCDDRLRIQDIVARWPGRAHDQTIFSNSRIKARFENGEMGNGLLLGDSGYGIRNYLITPLIQPNTPAENLFNQSQIRTRNVVERTFGVWKRRFPILSLGMRVSLETSQAIIIATAIVHNIAINEGDGEPRNDFAVDLLNVNNYINNDNNQIHNARRLSLINNHFANL